MTETRNPRKLRVWDSKALADNYNIVMQMQNKITAILDKLEAPTTVTDLPPSLVPTDLLYTITMCYDAMYEMLVEEHLIKTGNTKPSGTIH